MKRVTMIAFAATFLLAACNNDKKTEEKTADAKTEDSKTSEEKKETAWIPIDSAKGMQAMFAAGTPGEPHKMLAKSSGTWTAEVTSWMAAGKPPSKMMGTSVSSMLFDGRYQQSRVTGSWEGMPFEGMSIVGYDNTSKQYFSTWIDNMSTGFMHSTGTWDDATKSLHLSGTMKNPANGLDCKMREVFKIVDDNNHVAEMFGPDPQTGKEYKMMEIKYTKKK